MKKIRKIRSRSQRNKKLLLLTNGLCFLLQAIEHFKCGENNKYNTDRELKYSTLHLFSGISLILKEKLKREHWSLLFADVNKANEQSLMSGGLYSVDFTECQNRLSNIVSVKFTKKQKHILSLLREKRNKIEHFFESESLDSFKPILARCLIFSLDFIKEYLNSNLSDVEKKFIEQISKECFKLEEFVKEKDEGN